jgi:hypothetical protein
MSNPTEQEVRAFVGPKSDYYLKKWHLALEGMGNAGNATGFNWAALFLSGLWLPYRKMYRATLIFFGVILLETLFEEIVYVGFLGRPEAPGTLGRFVGFVAGLVCGGFGNAWYLAHAQKTIGKMQSQGLPEDAYFKALTKHGGTNIAASLGFLLLFILAAGVVVVLSELFLKRA